MKQNKRNYKATFVIDHRGKEDTIDQIIEGVKKEIAAVDGEVQSVDNIGKKDFARVTDRKFAGAPYVHVTFSGTATTPSRLRERLRLNNSVYRTFVVSV